VGRDRICAAISELFDFASALRDVAVGGVAG
jgi:hypothetical protein